VRGDGASGYRLAVQIRELDPRDDAAYDSFYAVYAAAESLGRPHATTYSRDEVRAMLLSSGSSSRRRAFVGTVGDAVVAVGDLELPLLDNTHLAELAVHVRPDQRRRGWGRSMAAHLRAEARAEGRRLASAWVHGGLLDPDGRLVARSAGSYFCAAVGLEERNVDVHRILALPVADNRLVELAEQAAAAQVGYQLVGWSGACPEQYVAAYLSLKEAMLAEAPLGDVEREPERWTEQRLRESEAEIRAMGRVLHVVGAVAPGGQMVAHNEVSRGNGKHARLWNWDTLVLPGHRGHRLGLAVKVRNVQRVQSLHPDARELHTFNAVQNAPMVAINDLLGFRPVEQTGEWQGPLDQMTV
jgi:GNAT superfamily N-acetyltransferase